MHLINFNIQLRLVKAWANPDLYTGGTKLIADFSTSSKFGHSKLLSSVSLLNRKLVKSKILEPQKHFFSSPSSNSHSSTLMRLMNVIKLKVKPNLTLKMTLDEGPRSRDQWIQAILLVESFKLVPRPLDEGPRPKSDKLRLNLHGTCFGGKINWLGPKNSPKKRAPDLENQESG
jgi:hypothetical protein